MTVDIHTHIFPDKIAERAVAGLARTSSLKPAVSGTREGLLTAMKEDAVDISVLQPIATSPSHVVSMNNAAIENNAIEGLISFGAMHPKFEDKAGELDRITAAGVKGVKLHPDFQGSFVDSPGMIEIMQLCAERGLIVMLHGGLDISYPERNKSTPERLARILPRTGGATIIAAHLGGFGYFEQAIRCLADTDVYIDTSAVCGLFPDRVTRRAIEAFGAERVLLGSDSPWCRQRDCIEVIDRLGLSSEQAEMIKGANACRLLGLTLV